MRLRKNSLLHLQILTVEGPLTPDDWSILRAGARHLAAREAAWALDLAAADLPPEQHHLARDLVVDAAAHSTGNFWSITSLGFGHCRTLDELDALLADSPLAGARQEAWFEARQAETQQIIAPLRARIGGANSSTVFELRRERSRLKLRLATLQAELEVRKTEETPGFPAEALALRERIATTIENALQQESR